MSKLIDIIKAEVNFILKAFEESSKYFVQICVFLSLIPVVFINFLRTNILNNNTLYQGLHLNEQLIVFLRMATLSLASCLYLLGLLFWLGFFIRFFRSMELYENEENEERKIIEMCFEQFLYILLFTLIPVIMINFIGNFS